MRQQTLPPGDVLIDQAEHDALHPGKICQHCPIERWEQREMERRIAAWDRHDRIRRRVQIAFALAVLAATWVLSGLVHQYPG